LPTTIVKAVENLTKGAGIIAHSLVLMSNQVKEFQAANKATLRRKLRKRKRVKAEGTLAAKEGVQLTTSKEFAARSNRKKAKKSARAKGSEPTGKGEMRR
jgi:methionine salvage enolase-phosphatase E1